jgi:hypothetical protein
MSEGLLADCGVFVLGIQDEATVNEIVAESERIVLGQGRKPSLARDNKLGRLPSELAWSLADTVCPRAPGRVNGAPRAVCLGLVAGVHSAAWQMTGE